MDREIIVLVHAMETLSLGLLLLVFKAYHLRGLGTLVMEALSPYQPSGAILAYSLTSKIL